MALKQLEITEKQSEIDKVNATKNALQQENAKMKEDLVNKSREHESIFKSLQDKILVIAKEKHEALTSKDNDMAKRYAEFEQMKASNKKLEQDAIQLKSQNSKVK